MKLRFRTKPVKKGGVWHHEDEDLVDGIEGVEVTYHFVGNEAKWVEVTIDSDNPATRKSLEDKKIDIDKLVIALRERGREVKKMQ